MKTQVYQILKKVQNGEQTLEDAVTLIEKCDLEKFKKEVPNSKFHWGNYSEHLNQNYR